MSIPKISISMAEPLLSFINRKVQRGGYGSVSEYFRELVRQDLRADLAAEKSLISYDPERSGNKKDVERDRYRVTKSDPYGR